MKIAASMYKSSGPDFFGPTTGIPLRLDELRAFMTFSTNFGVTRILCSFRAILERKAGKFLPES